MEQQMEFIRFRSTADRGWQRAWEIYLGAFPGHERRGEADTRRALADDRFVAEGVWLGGGIVGICFHWLAEEFCYVEFLAVDPARRNLNLGSRILAELLARHRRVVLEIEPPEDELTCRRRGFYERMGFRYNDYDYIHPSYSAPFHPHRLMLMSHPAPLTPDEAHRFADFNRTCVLRYSEHNTPPRLLR